MRFKAPRRRGGVGTEEMSPSHRGRCLGRVLCPSPEFFFNFWFIKIFLCSGKKEGALSSAALNTPLLQSHMFIHEWNEPYVPLLPCH